MQDQAETVNILSAIASLQSAQEYQELNWEGSFEDYLKLIQENPRVTRNAFQRIMALFRRSSPRKEPEPGSPLDPYVYVGAPKKPRPTGRSAAAVAELPEE